MFSLINLRCKILQTGYCYEPETYFDLTLIMNSMCFLTFFPNTKNKLTPNKNLFQARPKILEFGSSLTSISHFSAHFGQF